MREKVRKRILAELLVVFFTIALFSTWVSQYLFDESLPVVSTVDVQSMNVQQVEEYSAKPVKEGTCLQWEIIGTQRDLKVGSVIAVKEVKYRDSKNAYKKFSPSYEVLDEYEATIASTNFQKRMDENGNEERVYTFEILMGEQVSEDNMYIVSVSYETQEREYVIPSNCFIGNPEDYDSALSLLVVKEKLMPWGYTKYVKEVTVEALERNQDFVSIANYPGDAIVCNAEKMGISDGDWVKVR